jgi:AcrR family transcriptional regulator
MSPKTADPSVRTSLVDTAARLIAERKPLTTRGLAAELGSSTMAVYTHFGSMDELRRAVREDGFARLAEHLARVPTTEDPVADLVVAGWAYCTNAMDNPNLYRVMFMEVPLDQADAEVGVYTFQMLVDAIQRCLDAGRFKQDDAYDLATQVWAAAHGSVALYIAGMLERDEVFNLVARTARNLLVAFGDEPEQLGVSYGKAIDSIAASGPSPS